MTRPVLSIVLMGWMVFVTDWAAAQSYPNKPIRILASEPGGMLDIESRLIAQDIAGPLGQPVIVENRPSAVLPDIAVRAAPDGYTMAIAGGSTWLTPLLQKTSYGAIKDFSPVTWTTTYPYILVVHPSLPVKSVKELIDLAKSKPGVLNIAATASPGGNSFLAAELFKSMAAINLVRIPYKGNAQGLVAVLAAEAQVMFLAPVAVTAHFKSGKLKGLAVTTLEASAQAPGLPTLAASGLPGYEAIGIDGILVPAGTPAAIIQRLNQEIVRFLNRPDVKEKFLSSGAETVGSSPEQFAVKIKSEIDKWGKVLRDAGIKPES